MLGLTKDSLTLDSLGHILQFVWNKEFHNGANYCSHSCKFYKSLGRALVSPAMEHLFLAYCPHLLLCWRQSWMDEPKKENGTWSIALQDADVRRCLLVALGPSFLFICGGFVRGSVPSTFLHSFFPRGQDVLTSALYTFWARYSCWRALSSVM